MIHCFLFRVCAHMTAAMRSQAAGQHSALPFPRCCSFCGLLGFSIVQPQQCGTPFLPLKMWSLEIYSESKMLRIMLK